jgi:hypothetical protein
MEKIQRHEVVFVMKQINIRLDNAVAEKLEAIARDNGYTLSGYIAAIISGHCMSLLKKELDTKQILLELISTADPDPTFVRPPEIPWDATTLREAFS